MNTKTPLPYVIDILNNDYHLKAQSYGLGKKALLLLGNGFEGDTTYLLNSHSWLKDLSYRVINFNQAPLSSTLSKNACFEDYIKDAINNIEIVRQAFNIEELQILGHGWGSLFAIEYALSHPQTLDSLILINPTAHVPLAQQAILQLRYSLGHETAAIMARYEALGELNHPEYLAAITLLKYRYICRLDTWPSALSANYDKAMNSTLHQNLFGENPFYISGAAANWHRLEELATLRAPTLIISGLQGLFTTECSKRIAKQMPHAQVEILKNAASAPFAEEAERYFDILVNFLNKQRKTVVQLCSVS